MPGTRLQTGKSEKANMILFFTSRWEGEDREQWVRAAQEERADYMATELRLNVEVPGFHRELTVSRSARARGPS